MRSSQLVRQCLAVPLAAVAIAHAPMASAQVTSLAGQAKTSVVAAAGKAWHTTQDLAVYALGLIGVSYRFGGETPEDGLDCSGLVRHVFQQVTGVTLPRTAKELSQVGGVIPRKDLAPGDLVFFNTRRLAFSHVGIYLGDNRFIHAPRTGREVEVASLDSHYWQKHFNGARRMVGVIPSLVPSIIASAEAAAPMPAIIASAEVAVLVPAIDESAGPSAQPLVD